MIVLHILNRRTNLQRGNRAFDGNLERWRFIVSSLAILNEQMVPCHNRNKDAHEFFKKKFFLFVGLGSKPSAKPFDWQPPQPPQPFELCS